MRMERMWEQSLSTNMATEHRRPLLVPGVRKILGAVDASCQVGQLESQPQAWSVPSWCIPQEEGASRGVRKGAQRLFHWFI